VSDYESANLPNSLLLLIHGSVTSTYISLSSLLISTLEIGSKDIFFVFTKVRDVSQRTNFD
jgi:hypothetical protein